jgi:hypothetical protein
LAAGAGGGTFNDVFGRALTPAEEQLLMSLSETLSGSEEADEGDG